MKKKSILWVLGYLTMVICILGFLGKEVYDIDPFFHYHAPKTDEYFYRLNNERSQNNGIIKYFDYDAMITGTSMTQCFRSTQVDELFGKKSIKVPFSGGSYKEINDNVEIALKNNDKLDMVIRSIDMTLFFMDKNYMREDLGEFPTYLYDDNLWNDTKYIFNRDVIFSRLIPMIAKKNLNEEPGITSFNAYSNWSANYSYGMHAVAPDGFHIEQKADPIHITDDEKKMILENVNENITRLAKEYPDVDFYYFFPPYSAVWWGYLVKNGTIYKQVEAEQLIIEEILKYPNIKLFSLNTETYITTNINNYKDYTHYGKWINSLILKRMKKGKNQITKDNYKEYLDEEFNFYMNFDYEKLNQQEDYEDDKQVLQDLKKK